MKKLLIIILAFPLLVQAQFQNDQVKEGSFENPIFKGDYPDPSLLVDGEDFYVVHSSFEYYPGLTIWHSKDLINWKPVTNALTTYLGSIWAPDLVKYNGKYYIYFPANDTNYVIVADDINGPWSEPIDLEIGNIDPGHIADDKGNRYLYFSNGGYVPLAKDGLSITGKLKKSYDGWPIPQDWTIECFCMEGPKLFKKGDYYYLTVAEGGTAGPATGHMVVSARSKSPTGPWENSPYNPIKRAESKEDQWWSVGHATVFEASDDNWWMILHAYEKDYYNRGRQSILAPLEWTEDGWFKVPEDFNLTEAYKLPLEKGRTNNYSLNDDFSDKELGAQWKFYKKIDSSRFEFTGNSLNLKAKGNSLAQSSPLLTVPYSHYYEAEVEMEIEGEAKGGLVLFYNEKAGSGILSSSKDILANLRGWQFVTEENVVDSHVFLKIKNIKGTVDMFYSKDGENWIKIENSAEVSAYHHNVLSGFLSLRIGLVSMGEGMVKFKDFKYTPIENDQAKN